MRRKKSLIGISVLLLLFSSALDAQEPRTADTRVRSVGERLDQGAAGTESQHVRPQFPDLHKKRLPAPQGALTIDPRRTKDETRSTEHIDSPLSPPVAGKHSDQAIKAATEESPGLGQFLKKMDTTQSPVKADSPERSTDPADATISGHAGKLQKKSLTSPLPSSVLSREQTKVQERQPFPKLVIEKDTEVQRIDRSSEEKEFSLQPLVEGFHQQLVSSSQREQIDPLFGTKVIDHFIHIVRPKQEEVWYKGENRFLEWTSHLPQKSLLKITVTSHTQPNAPLVISSKASDIGNGTWTIPPALGIDATEPGEPGTKDTFKIHTSDGIISGERTIFICKPSIEMKVSFALITINKDYSLKWTTLGAVGDIVRLTIRNPKGAVNSYLLMNTGEARWTPGDEGDHVLELEVLTPGQVVRSQKATFHVIGERQEIPGSEEMIKVGPLMKRRQSAIGLAIDMQESVSESGEDSVNNPK